MWGDWVGSHSVGGEGGGGEEDALRAHTRRVDGEGGESEERREIHVNDFNSEGETSEDTGRPGALREANENERRTRMER